MSEVFRDRRDARRVLAGLLEHYRGRADAIVLGVAVWWSPGRL